MFAAPVGLMRSTSVRTRPSDVGAWIAAPIRARVDSAAWFVGSGNCHEFVGAEHGGSRRHAFQYLAADPAAPCRTGQPHADLQMPRCHSLQSNYPRRRAVNENGETNFAFRPVEAPAPAVVKKRRILEVDLVSMSSGPVPPPSLREFQCRAMHGHELCEQIVA